MKTTYTEALIFIFAGIAAGNIIFMQPEDPTGGVIAKSIALAYLIFALWYSVAKGFWPAERD